eukprot:g4056.t1
MHPLFAYFFYDISGMSVKASDAPETAYVVFKQVLISMLLEDFLFYWIHRSLHHRLIYKYVHKQHHEFKENIGVAAEYFHPVEDIFNLIPFLSGPLLQGMHLSTFLVWTVIRISEIVDAHSGYKLPFSPWEISMRIQGGADRHEFHHSHNKGSYGSFTKFWDWAFGTDEPYNEWKAKQKAA